MYSCVLLCCKSLYVIIVNFMGIKFSLILLSFLSMIIYVVLYTWCLRYNICSTWFLDINLLQLKWKCSSLWLVHAWFIEISFICNLYLYYYELLIYNFIDEIYYIKSCLCFIMSIIYIGHFTMLVNV